jgi:alpha-tubulin suppressor-like RCC1 family protein
MTGTKFAVPNGSLVDLDRPTPISWFTESGLSWKKITTGPHFGSAMTHDRVFVWAYDRKSGSNLPPREVVMKEVVDVASTEEFAIVATRNAVHVLDPITLQVVSTLTLPQTSSWGILGRKHRFVSVSAGRKHIALLDDLGRVWTAGDNSDGQCGRALKQKKVNRFDHYRTEADEAYTFENTLACIWNSGPAVQVVCGGSHTVLITPEGKSYSFGDDSKIQLGLGDTRSQDMPDYVPHSGMGTLDPEVADMSRLFQPRLPAVKYTFYDRHFRWKPTEMKVPQEGVKEAILGDNFTVLRVGDSGLLMACGENQHGQCGRGLNMQQQTFAPVKLPKHVRPVKVACGLSHCVASLEDGSVYTWGGNSAGQLGLGNRAPTCPPAVVHRSTIRGPLIRDIITRIGKESTACKEELKEFMTERKRDAIRAESMLEPDSTLPMPPSSPASEEGSRMKQQLLAAIDKSRAQLMMSPEEQRKWTPVDVHASFNNTVIVMERSE